MYAAILTLFVLAGSPALTVDEAFEVLQNPRRVTETQPVAPRTAVDRACPEVGCTGR